MHNNTTQLLCERWLTPSLPCTCLQGEAGSETKADPGPLMIGHFQGGSSGKLEEEDEEEEKEDAAAYLVSYFIAIANTR